MHRIHKIIYLTIIFIVQLIMMLFIATGCIGPEGPEGPKLTGELTGYAGLVSNDGILLPDRSGILVEVEGTSFSSTTDPTGRYFISGLVSGTYTLSWTKSGYGIQKHMGYQFVGGGRTFHELIFLGEIPLYTAQINVRPTIGSDQVTISGSFNGIGNLADRRVRLFFGSTENVSFDPYLNIFSVYGQGSASSWTINLPLINIRRLGVASGTTIWIIAYSDSWISSFYTDIETGKKVFPDINPYPSARFNFILP